MPPSTCSSPTSRHWRDHPPDAREDQIMTLTTTDMRDIPPIRHEEAMDLAAAEYERFSALLRSLAPGDWNAPTICDRWDVQAVSAHVLGAAEACASIGENIHQMRLGHRVQRQ